MLTITALGRASPVCTPQAKATPSSVPDGCQGEAGSGPGPLGGAPPWPPSPLPPPPLGAIPSLAAAALTAAANACAAAHPCIAGGAKRAFGRIFATCRRAGCGRGTGDQETAAGDLTDFHRPSMASEPGAAVNSGRCE